MTTTVTRGALADALTRAASCVGKLGWGAIQNIRVEAADGVLTATGTDLDVGMALTIPADGDLEPILVAPTVAKQAKALTGEKVDLSVKSGKLVMTAGGTYRTPITPADDWPADPNPDDGEWKVPDHFWSAFEACSTFAGGADDRPILQGVRVADHMQATDSYRAASVDVGAPCDVLVPARIVPRLKGLDRAEVLTWDDRHASVSGEWGRLWVRLIEGKFPQMDSLWPTEGAANATVTVDAELLADVVGRAQVIAGDNIPVRLELAGPGTLRCFAAAKDKGDFDESIEATIDGTLEGPAAYNGNYLRSVVAPVAGDVRIRLIDTLKPATVTDPDGWWAALLMPVRMP